MVKRTKIKNEKNETLKAGCVIVNDRGEVLLVSDRQKKLWAFPKGHAETGETPEQVALREVREETGYSVQIVKRLPDATYTYGQTGELNRVAMFLARPLGQPGKSEKAIVPKWFPMAEARERIRPNLVFLLDVVS